APAVCPSPTEDTDNWHRARVYVCGIRPVTGRLTIAAADQDGRDGVGAGDLSSVLSDILCSLGGEPNERINYRARSDFNGDLFLGAGDLSRWLTFYLSGESVFSCGSSPAGAARKQ